MSDPDPELLHASRRAWRELETLHVVGYFAPEPTRAYVDLGLHDRLAYFPTRAAALGPVGPEVTVATFYVFAPWLVSAALPSAWEATTPERLVRARRAGVREALVRVLGEEPEGLAEALDLARRVCAGLSAPGRPLYAAHAGLDWPEDDLLGLWHAATLVREHRGDGHLAVLQSHLVDPVEATVLGGLWSGTTAFLVKTRGWSEEELAAAQDRLRRRGWLDTEGGFTGAGRAARQAIEDRTDELALEGWAAVGVEATARLAALVRPMRQAVVAAGVLPEQIAGAAG